MWISRYLKLRIVLYNFSKDFLGHALKDNWIKYKYIGNPDYANTENTQEKFILKRIYKVIINLYINLTIKKLTRGG